MSGFFGKLFGFDEEEEEECNNEECEEIPDETFSSNGDKLVEIDLNNPIPYHFFQTLRLRWDWNWSIIFHFPIFILSLNYPKKILWFSGDLADVKRWVEELGRDVNLSDQVYDERWLISFLLNISKIFIIVWSHFINIS